VKLFKHTKYDHCRHSSIQYGWWVMISVLVLLDYTERHFTL